MLSLKDLKKLDRDDLLDLVGLQRASSHDWVAPALALLVGVGVGLLLAPKPGAELRNDLRERLRSAQDSLPETLKGATASTGSTPSRSVP